MSTLPTGAGDRTGGDESEGAEGPPETPAGRLRALYERRLGEPRRETDVYAGFGLFFGGIALAAVGLAVFLTSTTLDPEAALFWQLREAAVALAMVGLPAFLAGVVVLLPVDRRIVGVAAAGGLLSLAAVGVFVAAYPNDWNVPVGPDYSAEGITLYAVGLATLAAAAGSALVAYHVERATTGDAAEAPAEDGPSGNGAAPGSNGAASAGNGSVDAETVRRDIDEALSGADLSWGGVEKTDTKTLELNTEGAEVEGETAGTDASATTRRSSGEGVDAAVAGLRQMQGNGDGEEARGDSTEDTVAALNEFREQREADLETGAEEESLGDRIRGIFSN